MTRVAIVLLGAALAYQLLALPLYKVGSVGPDFVLVVLLYLAIHESAARGVFAAALSGLLLDAISIEPFGSYSLGYVGGAAAVWISRHAVFAGGPWSPTAPRRAALALVGIVASNLPRAALDPALASQVLAGLLGCAAYSAATIPVIFGLLEAHRCWLFREPTPGRRRGRLPD